MMQGVAVKYHASIFWYVHSIVSEVLSCVMGCSHPEWSVNALNLLISMSVLSLTLDTGSRWDYLFDDCPNIGTIALILCVGEPFMSNDPIQFLISFCCDMWVRGYQSEKPLDDARCLRRICEITSSKCKTVSSLPSELPQA